MSDVYIGFMDEEVRPILEELQNERWNVLVIERNNIEPNGVLFERPISAYKYPVVWKGWCGVRRNADGKDEMVSVPNQLSESNLGDERRTWLNVFQQCMYMNMRDVYAKLPAGIMDTENGTEIKRKLGLVTSVSMLYMGAASGRDGGLPTKILIRSPEMGLQPGLIRTQLRGIFKALRSASNATPNDPKAKEANKLNLWSYGAGGAYCSEGGPGIVWNTKGSIYIGVERDKSAEKRRDDQGVKLYKGEISYCSEDTKEILYTTPTFYTVAEARKNVEAVFVEESGKNGLLKAQISPIPNSVGTASNPGKLGISITSNSFMGSTVKAAASAYQLKGGVNMEDYHLYKLVQSLMASQTNYTSVQNIEAQYPFIEKSKVIRIDADPASIPESVVEDVQTQNAKTIKLKDYATVLKWGMQGMIFASAPNELDWTAVATKLGGNVATYLVPYKEGKYVNPFLLETAQDMYSEMGRWLDSLPNVLRADVLTKLNRNPFNKQFGNIEAANQGNFETLKSDYATLKGQLNTYCVGREEQNQTAITDNACQAFLKSLYVFMQVDGAIEDPDENTLLPIWARGGWGAGSDQTYIVSHMKYSGSNVDRAFYKSTNSTVLAKTAKDAVTEYFV